MKIFIVGCGRILQKHLDSIKILNKKLSIVGISDLKKDKLKIIAKKLNTKMYMDYKEGIMETNPDIVSILTPSGDHAKNIIDILRLKKDVIVEKPMCLKIKDGIKIVKLAKKNKKRVFVVMQNKFNLPVMKLRQDINKLKFGRIFHASVVVRWRRDQNYYNKDNWRGTWKMDGGVLTNQASHHVDLLEWMLGEVESVLAKSITALADIEVEDTAAVILKFKSGALGIIEATTASRPNDLEGSLSLMGDKGSVVIEGFSVNKIKTWSFKDMKKSDEDILDNFSENPPNVYGFGHKSYYENVVSCINNGTPNKVDGAEGRKSLELINAIYEAIETRKEVFIDSCSKKSKLGRN